MIAESLTPKLGIREHNRHERDPATHAELSLLSR
jgi:hypothetical protein